MPLNTNFPKAVALVIADLAGGNRGAVGTAFIIRYPAKAYDGFHYYFVTAKHIIDGARGEIEVRVRNRKGGICELEASDWISHPTADIAVCPGEPGVVLAHDVATIPSHLFLDQIGEEPDLGDDVYFLGLLADVPEMEEKNVPMVRAGNLGAYFQDRLPIRYPDGTLIHVTGHLIDCRSYQGFSGSPCFVQFIRMRERDRSSSSIKFINIEPEQITALLGVVAGHFDGEEPMHDSLSKSATDHIQKRPFHTGVGIVTPVAFLTELLQNEGLHEMRQKWEDKHLSEHVTPSATLDA